MNECPDCGGRAGRLADCLHCSRRLCRACLAGHALQLRRQALDLHEAAVARLADLASGESRRQERAEAETFFDEAASALEERRRRVLDRLSGHGDLDDLLDECGRALRESERPESGAEDEEGAGAVEDDMEELVGLVRLLAPLSGRLAGPEAPVCCLEEARARLCDLLDAVDYAVDAADACFGLGLNVDVALAASPSSPSPPPLPQQAGLLGDDFQLDDVAAVSPDPDADAGSRLLEFWETDAVAMESRLRPRKKKRRGRVELDASCQTFKAEGRPVALAHLLGSFYAVETQPAKCVRVYNQRGNFLRQLQFKGEVATSGPSIDPYRLVACPVREWLLVVDNRNGCLLTVWPSGYAERRIGPAVSAKYSLNRPEDAATDGELIFACCPRVGLFIFSCTDDSVRATLPLTDPGCPVRLAWCPGPRLLVATLRCKSNRYHFLALEVGNPGGRNPALVPVSAPDSVSVVSAAQPALVATGDRRLLCAKSAESDDSAGCLMSLDLATPPSSTTCVETAAADAVCLFTTRTGLLADLCRVSNTQVAACDPRRNVILLLDLEKLRPVPAAGGAR